MRFFQNTPKQWNKGDSSPVSEADLASNATLQAILSEARPQDGWLSEETTIDVDRRRNGRVWIVDPIDGTRAFLKGLPHFAVCVGLADGAHMQVGVVHNPATNDTFEAVLGGGAYRNGAPIAASARTCVEGARMMGDKAMYRHPAWKTPWPDDLVIEPRNAIAIRMTLVAAGDYDGAVALSPKHDWDVAAASLIATEAGAMVTDHVGQPFRFDLDPPRQPSLVIAGKALHPLLLERTSPIRLP